jgi:uncharacterized protein
MSKYSPDPESVATFLRDNPGFLSAHPELLSHLNLQHQTGGKTVSLIERQIDLLRDKNRALEFKLAELVRNAQENEAISNKLQSFTRALLLAGQSEQVPNIVEQNLRALFSVPQTALRIWEIDEKFQKLDCALAVEVEVISLANSMSSPYCGPNSDFQAAAWLSDLGNSARSLAMIPLRIGASPNAFGLLVLGSADPARFTTSMGTTFLERIGELSSAALARLMPQSQDQ